ncbi:MAG: hypothetical protein QXY40_09065 [Candidatus Methanomethylicia archaeon]
MYVCKIVNVDHVSIWCWVKKPEEVGIDVEPKHRRIIDEAKGGWILILCLGCDRC